jgi:hypothetical protein
MPAVSKAQARWLHTKSAEKALGKSGVKEWIESTGNIKDLPERVKEKKESAAPQPKPRMRQTRRSIPR